MSTVLENVPKEMILIFKTNDLLRGLESTLDCRSDADSFITMSKHCLECMHNFDKLLMIIEFLESFDFRQIMS